MKNLIRKIAIWTLVLSMTIATYGCSKKKNNIDIQTPSQTSSIEQSISLDSESSEEHTSGNESQTTTGDESASSSVKEEETTKQEQQTTTKQETTTKKPETTTKKPETTSKKPEVTTTKKQETSNKEEETTTTPAVQTKYKEYVISTQSYEDVVGYVGDWYVVKKNAKYGVVAFDGTVKLPIKYDAYNFVGNNEIEFVLDDVAYIYSNTLELKKEYRQKEVVQNIEAYNVTHKINGVTYELQLYSEYLWDYQENADKNSYITRKYYNGMLIEEYQYYNNFWIDKFIISCLDSGKIIYSGFGLKYYEKVFDDENQDGLFISDYIEDEIIIMQDDSASDKRNVYKINIEGYKMSVIFDSPYLSEDDFYNGRYIKSLFAHNLLLNIDTLEWKQLPSKYEKGYIDSCYSGRGEWVGISTYESDLYDIVKGNTLVSSGYKYLDFSNSKYIRGEKNGKDIFLNYNGNILAEYKDASGMVDGKALVSDGKGLYFVDESFNKISDYIYTGEYDTFGTLSITIGGKCYIIEEK